MKNDELRIMSLDFLYSYRTEIEAWEFSPIGELKRCERIVLRNRMNFDTPPNGIFRQIPIYQ